MNGRKSLIGNTLVEYLLIAVIFAGLFATLPKIRTLLEDHHDQASAVLAIPH